MPRGDTLLYIKPLEVLRAGLSLVDILRQIWNILRQSWDLASLVDQASRLGVRICQLLSGEEAVFTQLVIPNILRQSWKG